MLSTRIVGPESGGQGTLVFLSGFPDVHNTFLDTLVPELAKDHRCIVACLPDFDQPRLSKFWGHHPREIIERLDQTIAAFAAQSPVTLVLHDWGSLYGLDWYRQNPGKVERLICLDVLSHDVVQTAWENSLVEFFWVLLYQWWLVAVFIAGRVLPPAGDALMLLLALSGLGPDLDPPPRTLLCPPKGARWFMAYPYLHEWLGRSRRSRNPLNMSEMEGFCPVLYVYGTRKRAMFHSRRLVAAMAQDRRHRVVAYDCGHWVQHAKGPELVREIIQFVGL